jgi:hypothetical protein
MLARILNTIPTVTTDEYRLDGPKMGEYVCQSPWITYPVDNGRYQGRGQNKFRFDIPDTGIFNFNSSYIKVTVTTSNNGTKINPADPTAPYVRVRQGIWSIINKMRHLDNLQPIEEIFPYNLIYGFKWRYFQNQPYANSVGPYLLGIGTKANRNLWGSQSWEYVVPCDLSWIRAGPFPAKLMLNTQSIEITLEDPNVCLESNMLGLNYEVTNVELHVDKMLPYFPGSDTMIQGQAWEEKIKRTIESGEYKVMVDKWDWYQNLPVAISCDFIIPIKKALLEWVVTVFSNVASIGDPTVDDTMITYPKLDCVQYYMKIFTNMFPEQPVECRNQAIAAYEFYLQMLNAWKMNGFPTSDQPTFPNAICDVPIDLVTFNANTFFMSVDLRSTRYRDCINPLVNTDNTSTDMRFYLRLNSAPPANTSIYHFAHSKMVIALTPRGETKLLVS